MTSWVRYDSPLYLTIGLPFILSYMCTYAQVNSSNQQNNTAHWAFILPQECVVTVGISWYIKFSIKEMFVVITYFRGAKVLTQWMYMEFSDNMFELKSKTVHRYQRSVCVYVCVFLTRRSIPTSAKHPTAWEACADFCWLYQRGTKNRIWMILFKSLIICTLLYDSETYTPITTQVKCLQGLIMRCVWIIIGVTRCDQK